MFYSLALRLFAGEGLRFRLRSWQVNTGGRAPWTTILFIPFSVLLHTLKSDSDKDCKILRRCPICERDTIIGHGHRTKQAHDEYHDWIGIRRGLCPVCKTTFTFLPLFSPLYALQFAGPLSGITTAVRTALFVGRGDAYMQRP
jgi:hypothetical protein